MKIVINEKKIKRNKLIGQITTFSSLATLAGGLVLAFGNDTTRMLLSYVALILGFILSQIGIFYTNRYGRNPRYDEVIFKNLEKLGNDYTFYVYSSPIPILIVGPCGFWIPIPVSATGRIAYLKGRWRQQGGNFLMKAFAQEGIGRPEVEERDYKKDLMKLLQATSDEQDIIPPIKAILVLLMPNAEIGDVGDAPISIMEIRKLRRYIRKHDRDCVALLSDDELSILNKRIQI